MQLTADIIYFFAELSICFGIALRWILCSLLKLAFGAAIILAPVAIPELILRVLSH